MSEIERIREKAELFLERTSRWSDCFSIDEVQVLLNEIDELRSKADAFNAAISYEPRVTIHGSNTTVYVFDTDKLQALQAGQ